MRSNSDGDGHAVLYSFRRCPYAIRARLAIKVSGVAVNLREVSLQRKPAALIEASPKATVPVLKLPGGVVLDQSLDIMRWALNLHDPEGWVRPGDLEEVHTLVDLNDGPFKQALDRYKYAPVDAVRTAHTHRDDAVALMLSPLNDRLARRRFLLRDTPSLADMAIAPFVRQFAAVDAAWFDSMPFTALRAWLQHITGSRLFVSVMDTHRPWRPGDPDMRL